MLHDGQLCPVEPWPSDPSNVACLKVHRRLTLKQFADGQNIMRATAADVFCELPKGHSRPVHPYQIKYAGQVSDEP